MAKALWTPSPERVDASRITRFLREVNEAKGLSLHGYDELWAWSVENPAAFWEQVWKAADVVASKPYETVLRDPKMPGATWFPGARLNFAENLLRHRDDRPAIVWRNELGKQQKLTYAQLYDEVSRMVQFLEDQGISEGDVIGIYLPNRVEGVVTMLAATALGCTFTSCSPDFGYQGVLDRFSQTEPKILVTCDGYFYGGQRFDNLKKVQELLLDIYAIERVILVPVIHENPSRAGLRGALMWKEAMDRPPAEIHFTQVPFDHPLYVLYSSGTTGKPKGIVHGVGGTLLQHWKEHALHTDVDRDDVLFYFTTTGWMMWNWLVSGLQIGCTIVLFDGNPAHPDIGTLWKLAADLGVTVFGTSPKFLASCAKAGYHPAEKHGLSKLKAVLSTGSPLPPDLFEWVYAHVKSDVQLASISGGTDIVSCFMLGSPIDPVYLGEIQKRGLGMAVEAWTDDGKPVVGERGELVCTKPFPSMPVRFWDDKGGKKYKAAYFEHFPGVWRHGDFVTITEHGGVLVHGRSDATLNPGGVRIGSAEVTDPVEALPEVAEALAVGHPVGSDVEIVLFVVLRDGATLDAALTDRIKKTIRAAATPRHVPAKVLACPAIPRTASGKKVEIAVSRTLQGVDVPNRQALANPASLDWFKTVKLS